MGLGKAAGGDGHPRLASIFREKEEAYPVVLCRVALSFVVPLARASLDPSQVLILVNKDTEISNQVAKMYQNLRAIPSKNVLRLSLGTSRYITPEQYWGQTAGPIKKYLEANPEIQCILTTSGVPYTVQSTDGKDDGAAFDNELALVLREEPTDRKRRQPNPLYLYGMNSYGVTDARKLKMVYVVRLDGPDLKIITRMVQDAIAVEKTGLQGPVFGDARGLGWSRRLCRSGRLHSCCHRSTFRCGI